jgi:ubiquinone biosynthesis protein UbiJ
MQTSSVPNPLAPVFVLAQLETLINGVINNAPATALKLRGLAGRVAHFQITAPQLDVFVHFDEQGVRLTHHCEDAPALGISGSAPAMIKQVLSRSTSFSQAGLKVAGDLSMATTLQAIARDVDFDWEDLLARYLGDITAHQIGEAVRGGVRFLRDFARKAVRDSRMYLVHEKRMIVDRQSFTTFRDEVFQLREDYDRLEARIHHLRQRMAHKE